MTRIAAALILLIVVAAGAAALEQDFFGGRREPMPEPGANVPYDGKLTFVRLRYTMGFYGRRGSEPPWAHDYPTSDTHVMKILNELTLARPRMDGSNILTLDDPELFKYPIVYLSEPGFWSMDEEEVKGLRDYRWVPLDASHPIFHSFFEINDPHTMTPPYGGLPPSFYAMFENNNRNGRVMAMANVNNDLGVYWEFSDTGYAPVDLSNEAYKFGVNYFIYAMTH